MANILITGGSRGIGAEAVRQFTAAGHKVVFTYHRSETAADLLRQETGAVPVRCDVKHPDSVKIAVDKAVSVLGQIDVLICNAAIADYGLITDLDISRWEEVINTDLSGVFYCVRHVLPAMISRKSGCIITVGSMWGEVGASCEAAYSAAKAGVIGLTKALAKEVGPSGIRVNCISPGMIDTDMNASVSEDAVDMIVDETPLCRTGAPSDVARAMLFLASDDASFITGQVISVNGGLVI
ncbi:MAG: 3-oxoacyl-ACP reductase FabG [Mogibacterium sp.]|nr:3-oxoacyl-ACP reductase FabG [Mogibacterium sp.]MBR3331556.1 3-oxoacyl-ACP reductase FabG [Mogibacterium sp.]MBR4091147.1 3-oxoacyl-ACP reductase FabG [Mogibacterium sp.]